ncbi:hypothetical protein CDAR_117631, partial [Caerostris darwini]
CRTEYSVVFGNITFSILTISKRVILFSRKYC